LSATLLGSLRNPVNRLSAEQGVVIGRRTTGGVMSMIRLTQGGDHRGYPPTTNPPPLRLSAVFIRFLTQLITAIVLVGPNPVGLVVSTQAMSGLQQLHPFPTSLIFSDVSVPRVPGLADNHVRVLQATYRMILALRVTLNQLTGLLIQNVQQSIITGLTVNLLTKNMSLTFEHGCETHLRPLHHPLEPWCRLVEGVLYGERAAMSTNNSLSTRDKLAVFVLRQC
jgi:hypothetical protein